VVVEPLPVVVVGLSSLSVVDVVGSSSLPVVVVEPDLRVVDVVEPLQSSSRQVVVVVVPEPESDEQAAGAMSRPSPGAAPATA
jgi:hypothetical protein